PALSPDWLEVDNTVTKNLENHPQQNNVSWPVGVDNTVTKNLENHPQQNNVSWPVGGGTGRD
ncbi:MAG: hypothetical protein UFM30_00670, partial [Bacteroidales bacterium]|nr:hypothetical protein [Bacteroidales bacterium]